VITGPHKIRQVGSLPGGQQPGSAGYGFNSAHVAWRGSYRWPATCFDQKQYPAGLTAG